MEQAAPHGWVPPRAFALELHSAASTDTTASEPVDLFNQSAGSGRRDFLEPSGGTGIDKAAYLILVRDEGTGLDASHGLTHILFQTSERLQRKGRAQAGIGFDGVFDGIVTERQHSAVCVMDQHDGSRVQQSPGNHERPDGIVADDAARIANHMRVPFPDGYRFWNHVKSMVLQEGHPLYDSFGGIHHIYANEEALTGYREGTFPDGAILVFGLLEAVDSEDKDSVQFSDAP